MRSIAGGESVGGWLGFGGTGDRLESLVGVLFPGLKPGVNASKERKKKIRMISHFIVLWFVILKEEKKNKKIRKR